MQAQTFTLLVTINRNETGELSHNEFAHAVEQLLKGKPTVLPLRSVMVDAVKGIHATAFSSETRSHHRHATFKD